MIIKAVTTLLLCAVSAGALAHPCESSQAAANYATDRPTNANAYPGTTVPRRQKSAQGDIPTVSAGPQPNRYSSYEDMAADPRIKRLFKPWIGKGSFYLDSARRHMKDLTNTRRNSYNGLVSRNYVNCKMTQLGKSQFVAFGQSDAKIMGWHAREIAKTHGGVWPSSGDVSPEQQAKYESYCELFHQLAPHFIAQGDLEP